MINQGMHLEKGLYHPTILYHKRNEVLLIPIIQKSEAKTWFLWRNNCKVTELRL
jgi:hypothetical protein